MRILFVGFGNLGSQVFDLFLLRSTKEQQFLVTGRNLEYLRQRASLSIHAAIQLGLEPDVDYAFMDVAHVHKTAETIAQFKPDIIFTSVTVQASSAISHLPKPVFEKLAQAQAGPWMPLSLVLVYKLMQAVRLTGLKISVLNAASSDNANSVLGKVGLAPTTGVGNLANLIPAIRRTVALQLGEPWQRIHVFFIGHNQVAAALRIRGTSGEAPFHLTVLLDNEDVTNQINLQALFRDLPAITHEYTQLVSASSVAIVFDALIGRTHEVIHAPGPQGLPGAYPLRAGTLGFEIVLPPGMTLEEAIRINQAGQELDGIEKIEDDGTVYFTEKNMAILKETLGYECRRMPLSEVEERAKELRTKYLALANKYQ
jgi:hypothetical protein